MTKVYSFTKYDIISDRIVKGKRMGTLEFIKAQCLTIDIHSEIDVPDTEIDSDGLYQAKKTPLIFDEKTVDEFDRQMWESRFDRDAQHGLP